MIQHVEQQTCCPAKTCLHEQGNELQEKLGYSDCTQQNASAFAAAAVKSGKEVGMLNAG